MTKNQRKDVLSGSTRKVVTGCGNLYVTCNYDDGKLIEVLARLGKSGACASALCDGMGRLITQLLQISGDIPDIIKTLKGITCHAKSLVKQGTDEQVMSCIDGMAKALESEYKQITKEEKK